MRHPFCWSPLVQSTRRKPFEFLFIWLDVWTNILELLASQQIESFAIINYEVLVYSKEQYSKEISVMIKNSCHHQVRKTHIQDRRKLEFHRRKNDTSFINLKKAVLERWKYCEKISECHDLMNNLGPIMLDFGYTWNKTKPFLLSRSVNTSTLLFSSQNRPSQTLVKKMKALLSKYV